MFKAAIRERLASNVFKRVGHLDDLRKVPKKRSWMRFKKKEASRKSLQVSLFYVQMFISINKMIGFHLLIILLKFLIELPRQLHAFLSVKLQARTSSPMAQRDALWHPYRVTCSIARLLSAVYYWFIFKHLRTFDKRFVLCFCV